MDEEGSLLLPEPGVGVVVEGELQQLQVVEHIEQQFQPTQRQGVLRHLRSEEGEQSLPE